MTQTQARERVAETMASIAQYQRTIGQTPAQRLSWLGDFAARDLGADDASLDEAATLLNWFVVAHYRAWAGDTDTAALLQHPVASRDVPGVQRVVREVLDRLEPGGVVWFPQPIADGLRWSGDRVVAITRQAGLPQVLAAVADVLAAVGSRLRRCETPTCRRLFAFNRPAQKRCRVNCGGTERVRAWREQNRQRLSERNHQKYARKVNARLPGAKVSRRPRKGNGNG